MVCHEIKTVSTLIWFVSHRSNCPLKKTTAVVCGDAMHRNSARKLPKMDNTLFSNFILSQPETVLLEKFF